jgi:hypothetical protein
MRHDAKRRKQACRHGFRDRPAGNCKVVPEDPETALALSDRGDPQNPVISNLVLAAVAYCDALTAKYGGRVNQKDHGAVVKILRDALGNRLPAAQETKLSRILGIKDDVQYGSRPSTAAEAQRLLVLLREFARWAEEEFAR